MSWPIKSTQQKHLEFVSFTESSVPIDCSAQPSRYYVCPHGEGVPCVDGPSMLCDLKADCPGGNDEKEDACSKCFTLFYLIYHRP